MAFFFIYACKENVAGKAKIKRKKEVNNHCIYNLNNYDGSRLQLERTSVFFSFTLTFEKLTCYKMDSKEF